MTTARRRGLFRAYAHECQHRLGDARCGVELGPLTVTLSVTAVDKAVVELAGMDPLHQASAWFRAGTFTALGRTVAVVRQDLASYVLTLHSPLPGLGVGNLASLTPGCDRRIATCRGKFANGRRFGGFPGIPKENPF